MSKDILTSLEVFMPAKFRVKHAIVSGSPEEHIVLTCPLSWVYVSCLSI